MKSETWKTLAAIGSITTMEVVALLKGIDGTILSIVIAAVSGLGGYNIAKWFSKLEK